MFSHKKRLLRWELGGLSCDENNLQCKDVSATLNTEYRIEEQK